MPTELRDSLTGEKFQPAQALMIALHDYGGSAAHPVAIPLRIHNQRMDEKQNTLDLNNLGHLDWASAFRRYIEAVEGLEEKLEASRLWYRWYSEPYLVKAAYKHMPHLAVLAALGIQRDGLSSRELRKLTGHTLGWCARRSRMVTSFIRAHYLIGIRVSPIE